MTGQNLVWVAEITAMRGILERDPGTVAAAFARIAQEIRVSTGEGIQADWSFHQHGPCLYSHGYGAAFASDCSRIAGLVTGTRFAFAREKIDVLTRLVLDGSQWLARGAAQDFGADGREITRRNQTAGYLAGVARNMLALPTGREKELEALAARASGKGGPFLSGNRHFWRSDTMVHHREGFYASARMHSDRVFNTDMSCNDEGLKSHRIADGCCIVMRTGEEYREIAPVWDWRMIPGTTAEISPGLDGDVLRKGTRPFAGGVSDGACGAAAFDFARGALVARKAWFFFDREVVCLGAGITCGSANPVVTTVNQCLLKGAVTAAPGGSGRPAALDRGEHSPEGVAWIHHDDVAYVFPGPAKVRVRNDVQQGSWWDINRQYPKERVSQEVFRLWIEHGTSPRDASYTYIVAPGVALASVPAYAARPEVDVLRNDPRLQAARHRKLGMTAAAFYEPGRVEVPEGPAFGVDRPCLVLLRQTPGKLSISVSNPEGKGLSVAVEVDRKLSGEGVTPLGGGRATRVTFDLPGGAEAGSSVSRTLGAVR